MTATPVPTTSAALEQAAREHDVIERVVASFTGCTDPRMRQVMQSLTRHLHAYIPDVRLPEQEWSTRAKPGRRRRQVTTRPGVGAALRDHVCRSDASHVLAAHCTFRQARTTAS